jgi:hypothetical protein
MEKPPSPQITTTANNDNDDDDITVTDIVINRSFDEFTPIHAEWQNYAAALCKLNVAIYHRANVCRPLLTTAPEIHKVLPDGNCFYRTMAFAITGSETTHKLFRQSLNDYMLLPEVKQKLAPIIREKGIPRMWPSSRDIFAAAGLLGTDIMSYTITKDYPPKWTCFPADRIGTRNSNYDCSIYITNENNIHFNYVMQMNSS